MGRKCLFLSGIALNRKIALMDSTDRSIELSSGITPRITPRAQHPISRRMIDEEALKVLYRLHHHGYLAYLVGGSVRDLLLGKVPKDFDVATNAHPHEITNLFKNSRIIGRRFRLAHVFFKGNKIVEVSTFRSHSEFEEVETEEGEIIRKDSFGTPEEDALRRDITINGLFYNIADFSIIDYVGGIADLERGIIRTIGDPGERFQQDPVRMIRVIRHAARTGFPVDDPTYQAVLRHREEIRKCSTSRIRDEFLRDLREGVAQSSLQLMLETGLLFSLFPEFQRVFGDRSSSRERNKQFFLSLFGLVDQLVKRNGTFPEAVLFALFLFPFIEAITPDHLFLGNKERHLYLAQTIRWAIYQLLVPFSFPKASKEMAYQILMTRSNLERAIQKGGVPRRLRIKKYFREAVLLYGIIAEAKGEKVSSVLRRAAPSDLLPWWPKEIETERKGHPPRRRRRRRVRRPFIPPR
jgi:poly(A) polymerase